MKYESNLPWYDFSSLKDNQDLTTMRREEVLARDLEAVMQQLLHTVNTYRTAANCSSLDDSRWFINRSKLYCLFAMELDERVRCLDGRLSDHQPVLHESEYLQADLEQTRSVCRSADLDLLDKYNTLFYKTYIAGGLRELIENQRDTIREHIREWEPADPEPSMEKSVRKPSLVSYLFFW